MFPGKPLKTGAFYNCRKLSHLLWKDIRRVGKEAFSGCASLKPEGADSLEWVGELAFAGMEGMETAYAADRHDGGAKEDGTADRDGREGTAGIESQGPGETAERTEVQDARETQETADGAECQDKESQDGEKQDREPRYGTSGLGIVGSIVVSGAGCQGEVYVPEGITAIAPYAFSANRRITGLVLPETLRSIGEGAFWGCSGLAHVRFPAAPCAVGSCAFEKCTGIRSVHLRTHSLGASAFAWCLSLERAEITGLSLLEKRLFEGCENLKECVCGQVSAVGDSCFRGCSTLENFDFQTITEIGSYAFQDCDNLREIGLHDHTLVRPHGFQDCGRLARLVLTGEEGGLELGEYAFSGCTALRQVVRRGRLWELGEYRDILSESLPEPVRLIFHSALSCFQVEKEEILLGYSGLGRILNIPRGIRRIIPLRDVSGCSGYMEPNMCGLSEPERSPGAAAWRRWSWRKA